jgi:hypothetical protein
MLLTRFFDQVQESSVIHCDNKNCVKLSKNIVFHDKSKHIKIKYHYIHEIIHKGAMKLQYISIDE